MGLAASQGRYIFITQRKITLEGALMINSNKQIRLAQEAAELSEEKNAALSEKQWELNGNANFDYDMLMGDTAMNSDKGLYMVMTAGKDSKIVLNNKYATAMCAAGVPTSGGAGYASDKGLSDFMSYAAGSPKTANNWLEVINDASAKALQQAEIDALNFKTEFGSVIPTQGSSMQYNYEDRQMTLNDVVKNMGKSTVANKSYSELLSSTGEDFVVCLWKGEKFNSDSANKASQSLDKYVDQILNSLHTALGTDLEILKQIAQPLCDSIKSSFRQTDDMRDSGYGDSDRWARKGFVHCGDQGQPVWNWTNYDNDSNYSLGDYSSRNGIYEKAININLSELVRRLINTVTGQGLINDQNLYISRNGQDNDRGESYNRNKQYFMTNSSSTFTYTVQTGKDVENTNGNNVTYNQWMNAYNALSAYAKTIVCEKYLGEDALAQVSNPNAHVANISSDVQTLNKYRQIYDEACNNGWTMDSNVDNRSYLTNKLENNQYTIKHGDKKNTMRNFEDFKQVKKYDEDEIKAYYETEEKKIQVKEKKLQTENDRIQVELASVNSEAQSVKTLIDKNIERGFSYGYNA